MAKKLIIPLAEIESSRELVYVGDHVRASTATSVVLLDANTLACAHFNGCKMFLVRFDVNNGTYEFLDSCDTTFNGQKSETDLMATDGHGNLAASNFFHRACTLYRYENNQIHYVADLPCSIRNFVHGVKYYNENILAVTARGQSGGVHFIDRNTHKHVFRVAAPGLSVQDVCFLSDNRLVMISGHGSPKLHSAEIYSSVLHVIDFNISEVKLSIIAKMDFAATHLDNIVCYAGRLYFTDQYNNKVICLDADTLAPLNDIVDYDFPHGIDVNYGIIAVTNYGSNTIEIRSL